MKSRITKTLVCALPLALAFACGGTPADSNESEAATEGESQAAAEDGSDIIASADVGYGTVYFHESANEADNTVAIGISELAPGNYVTTPLQQMLAEGHTNLEVFMALLPSETPPTSFVDAHAVQAEALGRETDAIVAAQFDADAPIEKSVSWCKAVATPTWIGQVEYTYSNRDSKDDVTGTKSLTLDAGKKAVAPAICNENKSNKTSSHTVQGRVRMKKNGGSYDSPGWTPKVAPGWAWYWHGLQLTETDCSGGLCLPVAVDATYKLEGKSNTSSSKNTYDLYIAKITSAVDHTIIR